VRLGAARRPRDWRSGLHAAMLMVRRARSWPAGTRRSVGWRDAARVRRRPVPTDAVTPRLWPS